MASVQQLTTKENLDKVTPTTMEEQTVPSAGFSPQPNPFESINYTPKFNLQVPNNYVNHHHQQQQQHQQQYQNQQQQQHHQNQNQHHIPNQQQQQQIVDGIIGLDSYGNLGDTFDFEMSLLDNPSDGSGGGSLLTDCAGYDLATVPSPSSWSLSSGSGYEGTSWNHTMSLYAASPTGGNNGSGSSPHLDMCAFSPDSKPIIQALSPNSNYDSSNLNYSSDSSNSYQSYPGSPIPGPNNNNSNNGVQIKMENGHDELLGVPPGGGGSGGVGSGNGNGGCHDRESQCQSQNQQQTQENLNQQNLLLRQCLADTTFQKKYNFKPLEFPAASLSSLLLMDDPSIVSNATHELDGRGSNNGSRSNNTSSGGNSAEFGLGLGFGLNGIEPVFSMAFEHIRSDIHNACSTLAISPDPMEWSASDVQSWLTHVLSGPISPMNPILMMTSGDQQQQHQQQQCTATALRQFWNCDGRTMCSFSEEEFRLRDPVSGDGIFYNLELWKMLQFQNQNQNLNNKGQHQSQDGNSTNTNNNSNVNIPPPAIVLSRPTTMTSSSNNTNSLRGSVVSAAGVPGSVSVPEVRTNSSSSNFDFDELFLTPTTISSMLNSNSNNSSDLHHRSPTPQLSSSSTSQGGGSGVVIVKDENHSVNIERLSTPPFETSHNSTLEASPSSLVPTSAGSGSGTELMHTDDDDEEDDEDCDDEDFDSSEAPSASKTSASVVGDKAKGKKSKGATASNTGTGTGSGSAPSATPKSGAHIHLWQFLKELLSAPQQHGSCIRWLDQSRGVFKIEDSVRVARLWGLRKNRPAMNYDKLSRSIRQYYRKGIMRKTERSQRLVYQFCHPYGL